MDSDFRNFPPVQLKAVSNRDRKMSSEPTVLKSNQWDQDQLTRLKGRATLNKGATTRPSESTAER